MTNKMSFNEFLTLQEKLIAYNVSLTHLKVTGAMLNGTWIGHTEASIQRVIRSADEICIQLQARTDYLKCVHITLRQAGKDVVARVDWAAYTSAEHNIGYDFHSSQDPCVPIATSADGEGYGVAELHFSLRTSRPILVDGSNIARHFPEFRSKALAYLIEGLRGKGYAPTVLFDANIRYVLKETGDTFGMELLEQLLREDREHTIIVPSETRTDDYLLLLSDSCGHPIISCDTFKEDKFRRQYPWLKNRVESGKKRVHAPTFVLGQLLIPTLHLVWPITERGNVFIQANSNGKFFCADGNGQQAARQIVANRDCPSDWERFVIMGNNDGTVSIKSQRNGKYLSAEIDMDGRLNACSDKVGACEKFWINKRGRTGYTTLRSCANKRFISVEPLTGQIAARAESANEWEWLTIIPCV